jgi:hypothetical protein
MTERMPDELAQEFVKLDVAQVMAAMQALTDGVAFETGDLDPWVRGRIVEIYDELHVLVAEHRPAMCTHLRLPQPAFLRFWRPFPMLCQDCLAVDALHTVGSEVDLTCDRCQGVFPNGLFTCMIDDSPRVFVFGLCPTCRAEVVTE